MEVRSGILQLALFLNCVVLAENNYHSTTEKKVGKSILHRLWKRETSCPDGEYPAENLCCKHCNAGEYAHSDCTQEHGRPDCKDCIEGTNYMDTKNGYRSCHICRPCEAGSALEELSACTVIRNRVCKCKEDFFCTENITAESDGCTNCQHCTKCEHDYAQRCSFIKDAVCKPSRQSHLWAFIALVPLVALILLICYLCRKSDTGRYFPFRRLPFIFPEDLKDIDLTNHLWHFAQNMDYDTVRSAVRAMRVSEVIIEDNLKDYPNDSQEQKFQLLKTWYNGHGRIGAFQDLIRTLQKASKQVTAEELIEIARRQMQQSQA